jgi:rhodanese-related sulfurtransferase
MRHRNIGTGIVLLLTCMTVFISAPAFAADAGTVDSAKLHSMVVDNTYMMEKGKAPPFAVIDARTKEQYDASHIFSAISIPEQGFRESMGLLPADKGALLVVYCNDMDDKACSAWSDKARAAGYTNVVIYSEGFRAWKEQHMPVAPLVNMH